MSCTKFLPLAWAAGAMLLAQAEASLAAPAEYLGKNDFIVVGIPSCNSSAFAQVPGTTDLFIARQIALRNGQLPGLAGPTDCDSAGKGQWGLVLDQFDWKSHKMAPRKVLLDTSVDPGTGHSRAVVSGGPMRGLIIRSAYDANAVIYQGHYLVSYECVTDNGKDFGVDGTSSCVSLYDPKLQAIDLNHTQVVVTGMHSHDRFYAAAVPKLLVYKDRLFVYWSALAIEGGKFMNIAVRGAELKLVNDNLVNKSTNAFLTHSVDARETTEVWGPDANDPMSDNETDVLPLWVHGSSVIAMSSQGGKGCTAPSDETRGCFRVTIVRASEPLGEHVFNRAEKVLADRLPTNPQEYTQPIRDPDGNYWFIGHFIKPPANGYSEQRPVPDPGFWEKKAKGGGALVMFPIADKSIWPDT